MCDGSRPHYQRRQCQLKCDDPRDRVVTTSLTEGHRIASDYFLDGLPAPRWVEETKTSVKKGDKEEEKVAPAHWEGESFRDILRGEFRIEPVKKDKTYFVYPESWWSIYRTLFKYDPNCLVHGVLFAKEQIKISRVLTAHLEAVGAARVGRSGVKFDRLGKTTSGQPIFAVDEETAREIRATFIIDLALLRSYGREVGEGREPLGLNRQQKEFLLAFALWKIQELLGTTFSYRSGCKLKLQKLSITTEEEKKGDEPLATELPVIDIGPRSAPPSSPSNRSPASITHSETSSSRARRKQLVGPPTKPSPKGKARSEMPLILEQSFPLGRFHATRWNQNPFEDPYGEWPPSSWRLLRALAARWFQYSRETGDSDESLRNRLLSKLAREVPGYRLPENTWRGPAIHQYHPVGLEEQYKYKKVPGSAKQVLDFSFKQVGTTLAQDHFSCHPSYRPHLLDLGRFRIRAPGREAAVLPAPETALLRACRKLLPLSDLQRVRYRTELSAWRNPPGPGNPVLVAIPSGELNQESLLAVTGSDLLAQRRIPPGTAWYYASIPSKKPVRLTPAPRRQHPPGVRAIQFAVGARVYPQMPIGSS